MCRCTSFFVSTEKSEKLKREQEKIMMKNCFECEWYLNQICKTKAPCLQKKFEEINYIQSEMEEQLGNIIKSLQGKAEADYKKGKRWGEKNVV